MLSRPAVRTGLVVLGAFAVSAAIYAALPGAPLGTSDTRANTTTALTQSAAAVARDADGDYVVAWTGTTLTDAEEVYFQRYNSAGVAQGDETIVNTTASGTQAAATVATDASGNFVVAWAGNGAQTGQVDSDGIFIQRYDSAGNALGDETRVNTTTTGTQELPAVAMDADGDFVVVWQSLSQDGSGQGVYAQRFDAAGAAQGDEFQVNTTTAFSQRDASVAMDLAGNFVVVWESNNQDGSLEGIFGRQYAADGTAAPAGEFAINTTTTGAQTNPAVASRADGEFVVAWTSADADGTGVHARRFDSTGSPIDSSEFAVNTATTGAQDAVAVARAAEGSFVIAWESNQGGAYDVYARRYDADGVAGTEGAFLVNATTSGDQRAPAVAVDADGDIVVAWQGGTDVDVFARRVVGSEAIDLSLVKTDAADPVSASGVVTYTLTVANLHPAVTPTGDAVIDAAIGSAAGVSVTDTLPAGGGDNVTFLQATGTGWSCPDTATTIVTCTLNAPLAPDSEAAPITITVTAPAIAPTDRTIVNSATVASSQYDDVAGNDTDTEDTAVCGAGESAGTLNVSNTSGIESQAGGIIVTRSGGTCGAVSVQVGIANGTASAPGDYAAMDPQTLSWGNGESGARNAPTSITVVDDAVYEVNETVTIALSNPQRAALGSNGTYTINDNEPAPSLSIADASIAEGNSGSTQLPFTVTLTPAPGTTIGRSLQVEYDTANGTATTGDGDYTAVVAGLLIFNVGDTTKTANVAVNGDVRDEDDETLTVTLSNEQPAAVNITDATATGTITDDDAGPTIAFVLATSQVSEAATNPPVNTQAPTHNVEVTLSAASSRTVSVQLSHAGSIASQPADYTASPQTTVSFAPGETSKNVTLTIALDELDEDNETVQLALQSPTNGTVGAQATHVVTITDNDPLPVLTVDGPDQPGEADGAFDIVVSLAPASGRQVTINYALTGTATGGGTDYAVSPAPGTLTFAAGETSKAITITPNNDALDENNETVVVTLSAPQNATLDSASHSASIIDDEDVPTVTFTLAQQDVVENVAGGTATATLQLSAVSGRDVTVPFTVNAGMAQAGDATNGTDFTMGTTSPVTIPAGSLSATIVVNIANDATNEGTENVRLAMTTGSLVNATAGATTSHVVHITNDDTLPQASFALAAQSGAEDGGAVTATIQLSRAAEQDVTLSYTLSGTALNPGDYTVTPASPVIIAEGEISAVLTLTPVDDARVEGDETAVVTLGSAVNAAVLEDAKTHTLTIANDDAAGVAIVESGGSTDVIEGGANDTYTLVLTSEPTTDVTIDVTSSGQTTVTASVTFTPTGPAAWDIPQTITVTAVDDVAGEGSHGDTITHAVSSGDADYVGLDVADVAVGITDDDVPAIILEHTAGGTTATEGGAPDSYTVVLSAAPAQDVTVSLAHDGQVTLSDTSLTFTAADWDQPRSVTVTAVDDDVAEGTHGSTVLHTSASADANFDGLAADLAAQIADDDIAGVVLSKTSASAAEGGAGDSYTVRLSSQPVGDVVVMLAPDAQVAVDMTEIIFNPVNWNLEVPVAITAVDDATDEASPHAGLVMHGVSATASDASYDGIAVADVAVAVTDNDAAPGVSLSLAGSPLAEAGGTATVTATLSAPSGQVVTVNLGYGGTATADVDYAAAADSITIPAGALSASTTFTAVDDAVDEADETVTADITTVVNASEAGTQQVIGTIADDEALPTVSLSLAGSPVAEGGGVATMTATLSAPSSQNVTVTLTYSGTAAGADYAGSPSITINAGQLTGTGTVTASQDTLDEADETIVVDVTGVTNATESGTQQVTVTITDDDAPPSVTLSASAPTMTETGGTATITATLSAASGQAVTATLGYGGTAASPADYTASAASITIPAGATTGSVTLTSVADGSNEPDETIVVDITSVTNGTESGTQSQTVTITDDDRGGGGGGSWSWLSLWLLLPAFRRRAIAA